MGASSMWSRRPWTSILQLDENKAIKDRSLLIKSVVMILLVVFGFVFHSQLHLESCTIALTAAA